MDIEPIQTLFDSFFCQKAVLYKTLCLWGIHIKYKSKRNLLNRVQTK